MPFREGLNSGLRNMGERGMGEILPGLFIGSAKDSTDLEELRRHGITHVVSIHDTAKKEFREIRYLILHLPDSEHQNMTKYIREVNDFIHSARLGNGRVLVHCIHGISRSPFFLLAYLLCTCNASLDEAQKVVRSSRPIVRPNPGFLAQLEQFYPYGALAETARLRRRHGADWCGQHRLWLESRLNLFEERVQAGTLCSGDCPDRSSCPQATCKSPGKGRARFRVFRRSSTGSSQDLSRHQRRSSSAGTREREVASSIRQRRQEVSTSHRPDSIIIVQVRSWPVAAVPCTVAPPAQLQSQNRRSWKRY